ncbi:MAG: YggS family pyridoxal phosphate-dependent enzyme [Myxococcota bacterium]|jgi:hypothetical protein
MDLSHIARNLEDVRARIVRAAERSGRDPESVRLLAVSKKMGPEMVRAAMDVGQTLFGENYVQELEAKAVEVIGAQWHMIGHLQTNKVRKAVPWASAIHTLDRVELAAEIQKRAAASGRLMDCMIEVRLGGEESKSGVEAGDVPALVRACAAFPAMRVTGLMCLPPFLPPEEVRPYFRQLRELAARITSDGVAGPQFTELSMGMSSDFEAAVEEGATIVRVGTAIFGKR